MSKSPLQKMLERFKPKGTDNGNREADQAQDGCAGDHSADGTAEAKPDASAGTVPAGKSPIVVFQRGISPAYAGSLVSGVSYLAMPGAMTISSGWSGSLQYPRSIIACDKCGVAHDPEAGHECVLPSEIDIGAVATIQKLAAHGLSPEEIATDMKIDFGWRAWSLTENGLAGAGTGNAHLWNMDKPMVAVCVVGCPKERKEECSKSEHPMCRVHALKNKTDLSMGMRLTPVGLWGDVIECETGWLATHAYPLGFYSLMLARAYGVCHMKEPQP